MDEYEKQILKDFEEGKFVSVENQEEELKKAQTGAQNYFKKNSRINIRISQTDLTLLNRKAVQEGIPYQTLISSVLHKFLMASFINKI